LIFIAQNEAVFAKKAAETVLESVSEAIAKRGRATWSLCGGSTPKPVFSLMAEPHYRERIDWKKVIVCWGDERCVPPDSAESNYKLAMDNL
jgi:6-phosphogluconolactonase